MAPLLKNIKIKEYDVLAIQKPWYNNFIYISYNLKEGNFYLIYPEQAGSRVCFYINTKIDPNT